MTDRAAVVALLGDVAKITEATMLAIIAEQSAELARLKALEVTYLERDAHRARQAADAAALRAGLVEPTRPAPPAPTRWPRLRALLTKETR